MTLDSGNIRFLLIFAGIAWRSRSVKQQWDNRKLGFSGFQTLRLRHLRKWGQHYYIVLGLFSLVPCCLSLTLNTWPWMTLNGLNGHFTLNFHYYERPLTNYLLLIYCRPIVCLHYICDQRRSAGNGVADRDPQNIWNPRKNCDSFVDATSSEP